MWRQLFVLGYSSENQTGSLHFPVIQFIPQVFFFYGLNCLMEECKPYRTSMHGVCRSVYWTSIWIPSAIDDSEVNMFFERSNFSGGGAKFVNWSFLRSRPHFRAFQVCFGMKENHIDQLIPLSLNFVTKARAVVSYWRTNIKPLLSPRTC